MTPTTVSPGTSTELEKESRIGGAGTETTSRPVRRIDLSDFDARRAEITEELWSAATEIGFFQVENHGIDLADVAEAFAAAERFFALPAAEKAHFPLQRALNAGWEYQSQVRPSIGVPDQKESYQYTKPNMAGLLPGEDDLPGFAQTVAAFEAGCWTVAMRILSCFADRLDLDRDFFARAHDPASATYQSTLRMLHYFAVPPELRDQAGPWRAGAHTDFDCLTLLFQREGQGGLQVLPGAEMETEAWTPVAPAGDVITCNIGDMLMRWSDDQLPSNFHRVRGPRPGEDQGPRYSMAFFAQANTDAVMESASGAWEPITAGEFLQQRIRANYGG
ncbi:MAG: 2OG-Fe(II) oxygenase family protein [Janthinobacterium lividum]